MKEMKKNGFTRNRSIRSHAFLQRKTFYLLGLASTMFLLFFFEMPKDDAGNEQGRIKLVRTDVFNQSMNEQHTSIDSYDPILAIRESLDGKIDVTDTIMQTGNDMEIGRSEEQASEVGEDVDNLFLDGKKELGSGLPYDGNVLGGDAIREDQESFYGTSSSNGSVLQAHNSLRRLDLAIVTYLHRNAIDARHDQDSRESNPWIALESYSRFLHPENVFVFVEVGSTCRAVNSKLRAAHCIPVPCFHSHSGGPLMSCIFVVSQRLITSTYVTFLTGNHVLTKHFLAAYTSLKLKFENFVMAGTVWDVDSSAMTMEWEALLRKWDFKRPLYGASFAKESSDIGYIVCKKDHLRYADFPPFLVAGKAWVSWLLSDLLARPDVTVIDASDVSLVLRDTRLAKAPVADMLQDIKTTLAHRKPHTQIGHLSNVDFNIAGKCPQPSCIFYPNEKSKLLRMVQRHVSSRGYITLISFNHRLIEAVKHWVCWTHSIGIRNFVLIAEDLDSYDELSLPDVPMVLLPDAPSRERSRPAWSSSADIIAKKKYALMSSLLDIGVSVLMSDVDTVWFENILLHLRTECSVHLLPSNQSRFSDALLAVQASTSGKSFWKEMVQCLSKDASYQPLMQMKRDQRLRGSWKSICTSFVLEQTKKIDSAFSPCQFPPQMFANGDLFFETTGMQQQAIWPSVVHTGHGNDFESLLRKYKRWGIWALTKEGNCQMAVSSTDIPTPNHPAEIVILITIIASKDPDGLLQLLQQLKRADYPEGKYSLIFNLEILVEKTSSEVPSGAPDPFERCRSVAQAFSWDRGSYNVVVTPAARGVLGTFLGTWLPSNDREFRLVLDESSVVSSLYATIIVESLDAYYFDKNQYNPQLFGICLQRQHSWVSRRAKDEDISTVVGRQMMYGYQLYGGYGTLFFPSHWERFQDWVVEGRYSWKNLCLPQIISNQWISEKAGGYAALMALMIRFTFNQGWFFLFFNLQDGSTFATSWNEKEQRKKLGMKTKSSRGIDNFFATNESIENLRLSPLVELPIFDLQLRQLIGTKQLSKRPSLLTHLDPKQLCRID